jgi:hypothetical protein
MNLPQKRTLHWESGVMTRFIGRTPGARSRTEAQVFFEEAYHFPGLAFGLAALAIGDVAIAVSMVMALG